MGHAWSVLCPVEERDCMTAALRTLDPQADCEFARDAEELRRRMVASARGERSALIGLTASGVSDVNLAAAVARDGHADKVVLALRSPSGSLRSRAARAGVDTVIDLDGVVSAPSAEKGVASVPGLLPECDGGRVSVAPGPSRASVGVRAPVLTFCSGRGGVGKTSVVACAAAAAASWGMRVEAVDLDLSCGNLYAALAAAVVPGLLAALARATDLVLVDTSPTFSDAVALAVRESDRVVLVHDRRPGSLASLSRTSGLAVRLGVARTRIARLENRVNVRDRTDQAFGRAEVGLEAARAFSVLEGGDEVADYLGYGDAAGLLEVGSPFAESVAACLAQLLQELGVLPEAEAAQHAAEGLAPRRRGLFGRRREAV